MKWGGGVGLSAVLEVVDLLAQAFTSACINLLYEQLGRSEREEREFDESRGERYPQQLVSLQKGNSSQDLTFGASQNRFW